jgi:hypothetical protein
MENTCWELTAISFRVLVVRSWTVNEKEAIMPNFEYVTEYIEQGLKHLFYNREHNAYLHRTCSW